MSKAKQRYLLTNDKSEWYFKTGSSRKSKLPVINLPNFTGIIETLIDTKTLYQGWITSQKLTFTRQFEDSKLFRARRVRLAKSSNMEDLSNNNISKLANDQNEDHDNNNIKNISPISNYKCKKG